jgi:hypothetical protein
MGGILIADFKFCENCGRNVSLNGQLCARCGADLSEPGESNVQDDGKGETVVGYTSHAIFGGRLATPSGVLLFTTDRMVAAKGSGKGGFAALGVIGYTLQVRSQAEKMASAQMDELLLENKKNFAVPYPEITKLHVKLPGGLTRGKVTLKTAQGEKVIIISNRGVGVVKDDWAFLKSPPPKLAGKIVVE